MTQDTWASTNTWKITTWNKTSSLLATRLKVWSNDSWEVIVMLPTYFYNDWFLQLAAKIYQNAWILVKYKTVSTLSEYKKILSLSWYYTWKIDLYLIPSDRLESFSWKKINLGEDIRPYFHHVFSDYMSQNTTFVPYIIDPLVTFLYSKAIYQKNLIDVKSLFSYIVSWKQTKKSSIPLLFGAGKDDIGLMNKWVESFPDYFSFWYNIIFQLKKGNNVDSLKSLLDTVNFNSDYKRNLLAFKKLVINISKRNPLCKTYPSMCIFSYRYADIAFGFVSDQILINQFTGWWIWLENVLLYNFPTTSDIYKVRWWWFVASAGSKNMTQIDYFLKMYIRSSVLNSLPLWENSLSSFNNIFQIQKIQERYENILRYEPNFSLIYGKINDQEDFVKKTNLTDLLAWKTKAEVFLGGLDWER